MQLPAAGAAAARGHLSYCTNIHAGESFADMMASLATYLPEVKARVAGSQPFGVGLRLGHAAALSLGEPAALKQLQDFLAAHGCYVFTLNGFPYGPFHGRAVKELAYKPDWAEPERLAYTDALADILSELLPPGMDGSLSTVPGTFKPWAEGRVPAIVEQLIRHVAHLVAIQRRKGQTILLALEPEPCCLIETIAETVDFFEQHLFSRSALVRLAALSGLDAAGAEAAMRRHVGVCYDVCHAAVEFEDAAQSLAQLRAHGIAVGKLQLSSALELARVDDDSLRHLAAFAEPVYLHQVVQRSAGGDLRRYTDLPQALAEARAAAGSCWRVHFHVPVFLAQMQHFGTTQAFLADVLKLHRQQAITQHLEVETYTWDVLPPQYRSAGLGEAIARELSWVKSQLLS